MTDSLTIFATAASGSNLFTGLILPFGAMAAIMYFLLIRPQQQQRKRHKEMLENLKKNDKVVTSGGLVGKVVKLGDEEVTINLGSTEVVVLRPMIVDVRGKTEAAKPADEKN